MSKLSRMPTFCQQPPYGLHVVILLTCRVCFSSAASFSTAPWRLVYRVVSILYPDALLLWSLAHLCQLFRLRKLLVDLLREVLLGLEKPAFGHDGGSVGLYALRGVFGWWERSSVLWSRWGEERCCLMVVGGLLGSWLIDKATQEAPACGLTNDRRGAVQGGTN